jgi:2-keto-3-deoxy-L-rhamnonate aldolase RhmA
MHDLTRRGLLTSSAIAGAALAMAPMAQAFDSNCAAPQPTGASVPDGVTFGIGLTCPSPELAQICAHAGFDVVMIDMEHGPISIENAHRMVASMVGTKAEAWLRVTHNDAAQIKRALDTGATNVVVPMVTTRAECEAAVAAAKYPPQGIRGWGPFRPQYVWKTTMFDYATRANSETRVTVLIEHPRALDNLDEILDVPGLGGALAVPFDLAVNMGFADGPGHPEVQEALAMASVRIAQSGFTPMSFAVTPDQGRLALAQGVKFLFLGFDTMFVPAALQGYVTQLTAVS